MLGAHYSSHNRFILTSSLGRFVRLPKRGGRPRGHASSSIRNPCRLLNRGLFCELPCFSVCSGCWFLWFCFLICLSSFLFFFFFLRFRGMPSSFLLASLFDSCSELYIYRPGGLVAPPKCCWRWSWSSNPAAVVFWIYLQKYEINY